MQGIYNNNFLFSSLPDLAKAKEADSISDGKPGMKLSL
jgi:hypothetical protein